MKRFLKVWVIIAVLVIFGVAFSWIRYPTWQDPASGGFWTLLVITVVAVWKVVRELIGLWNDLNSPDKNSIQSEQISVGENARNIQAGTYTEINIEQSSSQTVREQHGENIFNNPGGTVNFNHDKSMSSHNSEMISPSLELKFMDKLGRYLDQIVLDQTIPNQNFHFNIALINTSEDSLPAEKLDITVECRWDGTDLTNPPKFKTDTYERTTNGWRAIQQGDQPFPAVLSFRGSNDERCAYGHSLDWHRFSVVVFEKMEGRFVLNYRISSAHPKPVSCKGVIDILINSRKFGTKSILLNDIITGEELHIEFNLDADKVEINGISVKRLKALESNENQFVFAPSDSGSAVSKMYHLSRQQIEIMKAL